MKKTSLYILLFLSLPLWSVAQERILIGGILLDHLNGKPVMAAHVMNLTDSVATISSPEGIFKITVQVGDSLVFSSIGYHRKTVIITEKDVSSDFIEVRMVIRDYELSEVEVNPFGTKEQFRKRFMELEVDDGTIDIVGVKKPSVNRNKIPITEDENEIKKAKHLFKSPASFLYGNLSRDARKRQEFHRLQAEKEKYKYNDIKFSESVVENVTGYKDGALRDFMDYCNFSDRDILRYTDYQLTVAILNKQRSYERITQDQ